MANLISFLKEYKHFVFSGLFLISFFILSYYLLSPLFQNQKNLEEQIIEQQKTIEKIRQEVIRNNNEQIEIVRSYIKEQKAAIESYNQSIQNINDNRQQRIQQIRTTQTNTEIISNFQRELHL